MNKKIRFSVIGGDLRQVTMANGIVKDGHEVNAYGFTGDVGFDQNIKHKHSLEAALDDADIIVLPLPVSDNDITVKTPFFEKEIPLYDLFQLVRKNQIIVGGKFTDKIYNIAKIHDAYCIDYFNREEMTVENAIPTAEGALQLAMEEMPITLCGANVLLLGYGRISKILSKMLWGIGSHVTVVARKYQDLAYARAYGYKAVLLNEVEETIATYDLIINTIPKIVLDYSVLSKVNRESLIIDLSSKPGGVDFEIAKELGLKTIWALSLPGKVAPVTAGNIIKNTIYNILKDLGV